MKASSAQISKKAKLGKNVKVWGFVQIRENAEIGDNCIIGRNVYIDHDVKIGPNVKIQNNSLIYYGSSIEEGVFIGPGVCLSNDKYPRSTGKTGELKKADEWVLGRILIKKGASIGTGTVVLPGVTVGEFCLIGAGSVVTKSIPDYALAFGNPVKIHGFVCKNGHPQKKKKNEKVIYCNQCKEKIEIKNGKKV